MTFSAAGIWNDTSQANIAVQRESNAFENVLALAHGSRRKNARSREQLCARSSRSGLAGDGE